MDSDWVTCLGKQLIGADWESGRGSASTSTSPVSPQPSWEGAWADTAQASEAVTHACKAFDAWSQRPIEQRRELCQEFAKYVDARRGQLAHRIAWETGKPLWEAHSEVASVIGKVALSIEAQAARRWTKSEPANDLHAVTRFRPHGALLVLGPFNLPAHLPGAHIIPALLAGNTIVFKPSELTPAVGQWLVEAWHAVGLPAGVLNLVHGDASIARHVASDPRIAGVLFTGSYRAGASLHQLLGGKPEKILALEMGGNNPLIVHRVADVAQTILPIIESAFISSGQRCTCARRLIITEQTEGQRLLELLAAAISRIRIGLPFDQPPPYMGTLIRASAATRMLEFQEQLIAQGARVIVPMRAQSRNAALLSPGLIDSTGISVADEEYFGPLLQVQRVDTFDAAIAAANATRFGLAAGLLADDEADYAIFCERIRAGIVNWNRQTTGASGRLPFGGIGASGNHAPSGAYAADYCAYPVASLESPQLPALTTKVAPGLEEVVGLCTSK